METPEDETVVLEGEAAVNLWLDGEDAWNEWAAENPDAKVDFSRIDFSIYGYVFSPGSTSQQATAVSPLNAPYLATSV